MNITATEKLKNLKGFYGRPAFSVVCLVDKKDISPHNVGERVAHDLQNGVAVSWIDMSYLWPTPLIGYLALELGIPHHNIFVEKPMQEQPDDDSKVLLKATFFGARYEVSLRYSLNYDNGCRWNDFAYINLVAGDWSVVVDMTTREVTTHLMGYIQHHGRTYATPEIIREAAISLVTSMTALPLARGHRGEHKITLRGGNINAEFGNIVSATLSARDFTEKELLSAREAVLARIEKGDYDKLGWYKFVMP